MAGRLDISRQARRGGIARWVFSAVLFWGNAAFAVSVNDYGVVSDDPGAATANTAALRQLVSPVSYGGTSTYVGEVTFPDGAVYYFNDVITFRDGIHLDLMGSTLRFSRVPQPADQYSGGFIFALRDFSIANGSVEVDYHGTLNSGAGNALMLGQRSANSGTYFQPLYDSELALPMGNITVANLQISSNNENGACGITLSGGLQNVLIDNVTVDGQQKLICGIYYEFGRAENPANPSTTPPPASSHAHDMTFSNVTVQDLNPAIPTDEKRQTIGLALGGAYDTLVDGLTVLGVADYAFLGTAGEAAFYKMWPAQIPAADRTITLRNVTAQQVRTIGLLLEGAGSFQKGYLGDYLAPSSYTAATQTDELNYDVDGFNLKAATGSGGWGIYSSARRIDIRNGTLSAFESGIAVRDDCTIIHVDNIGVHGSLREGIRIGTLEGGIWNWNPPRPKTGYIKNSEISGSGTMLTGSYGITLSYVDTFLIESNVFRSVSSVTQSGAQAGAVFLGQNVSNVVSHENNVVSVYGSNPAYANFTGAANGNTLQGNTGVATTQGNWINVPNVAPVLVQDLVGGRVIAGRAVTLSARFSGTITSYTWLRNGVVVDGATSNTLTIPHVTTSSEGSYQVLAKNVAATGASSQVTLAMDADAVLTVINSYLTN